MTHTPPTPTPGVVDTDGMKTPAARWRVEGKPDPTPYYDRERGALCGGQFTDDEVAFKVAMLTGPELDHEAVVTMAKDRIRWLSRALVSTQSALSEAVRERAALIASIGEHITVRGEYLARAEKAEAALSEAEKRAGTVRGQAELIALRERDEHKGESHDQRYQYDTANRIAAAIRALVTSPPARSDLTPGEREQVLAVLEPFALTAARLDDPNTRGTWRNMPDTSLLADVCARYINENGTLTVGHLRAARDLRRTLTTSAGEAK